MYTQTHKCYQLRMQWVFVRFSARGRKETSTICGLPSYVDFPADLVI